VIGLLAVLLSVQSPQVAGESSYGRLEPSLFTVEVHSGNQDAKSASGSGYLVSRDGRVVTNYHVVGMHLDEPDRYSIRVRGTESARPARVVAFDIVNDLALLEVPGLTGEPLPLAESPPAPGAAVIAFGNPQGLGLSLVRGVFNGFAEKGLVDRMLLSMPLNPGMSGGPILDERDRVIGTNVAIMRDSDSLSFGVPVSHVHALLDQPPVETTRAAFLEETRRQLDQLEKDTATRLIAGFEASGAETTVTTGDVRSPRPPTEFECWDGNDVDEKEGLSESWYHCDLHFTPSIESVGDVAAVTLFLQHRHSENSTFGFYGLVEEEATGWSNTPPVSRGDSDFSTPHCVAGRFATAQSVWKANTCVMAYVEYPGFGDYELIAVSVSEPRDTVQVYLSMDGFRLESFERLVRPLLEGIVLEATP
jgi:serine protease Do